MDLIIEPYSPPSIKRLETTIFDLNDIFNCQTLCTGRAKIKISVQILGMELPMKKLRVRMQTDGAVMFQNPLIGWHEKMETRSSVMPQAITTAPTILVIILKPRPGKSDRYNRRMEILVMGSVMLEMISPAKTISKSH